VIANYTTKVPVQTTVAQVSAMLADAGAGQVMHHYGNDRKIAGVSFSLPGTHGVRAYTLPVNVAGVQRVLSAERTAGRLPGGAKAASEEQAARVAWRIAREWLLVQLALVQAQMVTLDQVMLPYLHVDTDSSGAAVTLYERYAERENLALTVGGETT
jgi:hypothetical protein